MQSEVEKVLASMASLLAQYGEVSWARVLAQFADAYEADPVGVTRDVVALFGGMGSLNDVSLYRDGSVAVDATEALDESRRRLYAACRRMP